MTGTRHRPELPQPLVVGALLALFCAYVGWRSGDFWTAANWQLLVQPMAEAGLVALGMTLVIATGGIDLSVGSIIGLSAVAAAWAAQHHAGATGIALTALLIGGGCGACNGLLIGVLGLSPILVTLGTMIFFGGLAVTVSAGASFAGFPDTLLHLSDADWVGVPVVFLIFILVAVGVYLAARYSLWGRYLLHQGQSPVAARFSAMPIRSSLFGVYTVQGLFCGLASLLMVARLASARADMGQALLLTAIAGVVLGGTPVMGGAATVPGTVIGIATFYVVGNGLTLLGVPTFVQTALVAGLLLFAVGLANQLRSGRTAA